MLLSGILTKSNIIAVIAIFRKEYQDTAIDYKADNLDLVLAEACPESIDVYYDNTAGTISDAVLKHLGVGARIVVCGTASIANWEPIPEGPRVERHLLVKRARMQGFLILDYAERYTEALRQLTQWFRQGLIQYRADILEGIEHAPGSIAGLYRSENFGKRLIQIAPQE
jgi:NADPH-dependent curcumin reductase CurA